MASEGIEIGALGVRPQRGLAATGPTSAAVGRRHVFLPVTFLLPPLRAFPVVQCYDDCYISSVQDDHVVIVHSAATPLCYFPTLAPNSDAISREAPRFEKHYATVSFHGFLIILRTIKLILMSCC